MMYLLAKYSLLFVLAAALGFWLGYWFSRRNMVDVSETYDDLRQASTRSDTADWERLWQRLDALPRPEDPDYTGLFARLDKIDSAISELPRPEPISFASIEERLDGFDKTIKAIPGPVRPLPVDLKPVHYRLESLERAVREVPVVETHEATTVDLQPIEHRLAAIETKLGELELQPAAAAPTIEIRSAEPEGDEPVILSAALYGEKDDLTRISGVGPKLERLLNDNGVYYFWQVASWSDRDIEFIDDRLDVFKGRISRDDWVTQAQRLKLEPGAASAPASA